MEAIKEDQIMFDNEVYNYKEFEDGSKRIFKQKNKRGFKINIKVSGNKEELDEGMQALKDFYAKTIL